MGSPPRALPNEPKLGPPSSSSSRDNQPPNLSLIWLKPNISETTSPRLSVLGLPVKGAPSSTPRAGFRRVVSENHRNRSGRIFDFEVAGESPGRALPDGVSRAPQLRPEHRPRGFSKFSFFNISLVFGSSKMVSVRLVLLVETYLT
ncbi:hypothetical protein ACJJTC_009387, partial [Scirpophaga incertulas]